MLSSGVPILDALEIVARTAGNVVVEREILTHQELDRRRQDDRRAAAGLEGLPRHGRADDLGRRADRRDGRDARQDRRLLRRRGRHRRRRADLAARADADGRSGRHDRLRCSSRCTCRSSRSPTPSSSADARRRRDARALPANAFATRLVALAAILTLCVSHAAARRRRVLGARARRALRARARGLPARARLRCARRLEPLAATCTCSSSIGDALLISGFVYCSGGAALDLRLPVPDLDRLRGAHARLARRRCSRACCAVVAYSRGRLGPVAGWFPPFNPDVLDEPRTKPASSVIGARGRLPRRRAARAAARRRGAGGPPRSCRSWARSTAASSTTCRRVCSP